ncbi:MAG: DUF1775 domain-containing protein [Acidobacteria bacterium]|nr:DUF1775 domain-containing protein [Acidobacteriota bacterium]
MKHIGKWTGKFWMACSLVAGGAVASRAHVTLRPNQPLTPGGYANVSMIVPNERHVNNVSVTLEIPEAFLKAGGRLNRVEYPAGWEVRLEKENKPGEVYQKEMDERKKRRESAGPASTASADKPQETDDPQEEEIMNELRKQWIKRVTFSGGAITPDGFKAFLLSFQLPEQPGSFRFPAVQSYQDGKEVSWSELVEGAEHPAPALTIENRSRVPSPGILSAVLLALVVGWWLGARRARHVKV